MGPDIVELAQELRRELKQMEDRVRVLMNNGQFNEPQTFANQHSEMKANIMLAVRHIEDARMRLGKLCQYAEDGVSILDK